MIKNWERSSWLVSQSRADVKRTAAMQDSEYEAKAELCERDRNDPCAEMWGAFT